MPECVRCADFIDSNYPTYWPKPQLPHFIQHSVCVCVRVTKVKVAQAKHTVDFSTFCSALRRTLVGYGDPVALLFARWISIFDNFEGCCAGFRVKVDNRTGDTRSFTSCATVTRRAVVKAFLGGICTQTRLFNKHTARLKLCLPRRRRGVRSPKAGVVEARKARVQTKGY